ncbi:urease accessory protein UreD [Rhodococcus sp. SGAir0479]|uniref:urease accessory protein UreD n=1 Tax=Rhodococcus sp. SGAir0479 TaxID=2567884 RepID=UPI0010CD0334|nr:urease accessory protein UreD [Rhodococcus sp. SGAir0479]QCQ92916.1 urease accessory protein UreD [Rhodococcus sp. SGAir0479]
MTGPGADGHDVPDIVGGYAGTPETLPAGSPGKDGVLELEFVRVGDRTEIGHRRQQPPLQIMRPLYVDPQRPDLPVVYLMSTGGGLVQGDRMRFEFDCGPQTSVHLTTQASTKVQRMDTDYAAQTVSLNAGAGAFVEYLPEPLIPFAGARLHQRTTVTVDPTATVVLGETVLAGRLARDERHRYDVFASDLEIARPDGSLLAVDTVRLQPAESPVTGPAVFGNHDVMGSLYVISPLASASALADALHGALEAVGGDARAGVSVLPDDCGAWVRVLGADTESVGEVVRAGWDAARRLLIGVPAPHIRRT